MPKRLASNNMPYREIDQNKHTGRCTLNNVVMNLLPVSCFGVVVLKAKWILSALEPARFVSLLMQTADILPLVIWNIVTTATQFVFRFQWRMTPWINFILDKTMCFRNYSYAHCSQQIWDLQAFQVAQIFTDWLIILSGKFRNISKVESIWLYNSNFELMNR